MRQRLLAFVVILLMTTGLLVNATAHSWSPSEASQPKMTTTQLGPLRVIHKKPSLTRATGADKDSCKRYQVCGTDLGIPYQRPDGSMAYAFGDTFREADPNHQVGKDGWRSPVILRSSTPPTPGQPIEFTSAAGISGDGMAPDAIANSHQSNGEYTIIPSDGISFPETGEELILYESIKEWKPTPNAEWQSNYSGLAISRDGEYFERIGPVWYNDADNTNPFQVMSLQRHGEYVYIASVRSGRQRHELTPMVLQRVPWNQMRDPSAYKCWGGEHLEWQAGTCEPILQGKFGEPSLRHLSDSTSEGLWALSYLDFSQGDTPSIVTQTAKSPTGPWSVPKIQLTWEQLPFLYGGFIDPRSTPLNLRLMVSTWQPGERYDVSLFEGTL